MGLLWSLLIGLAAGWIAGQLVDGKEGLVRNLVVGVIGAIIGEPIFRLAGVQISGQLGSLITAVVGASILLLVLRLWGGRAR